MTIEFRKYTDIDDIVIALVTELDEALSGYAPEQHHGFDIEAIFQPNLNFYVGFVDDKPAACGAIGFYDGFAELKRMYVRKEFRGTSLAKELVKKLEQDAIDKGFKDIRLETGIKQHAALRMYEREGYKVCDPFYPYTELDPFSIETSVFMKKLL